MRETMMRTKTHEKKINETNNILLDVKNYLGGQRDCVTTQGIIGIDKIFRVYVVKDWYGDEEDCESYPEINKIIVKKSVEFYAKCWDHRNSCLNESETKRKMVMDWHENEKREALNGEYPQVARYVRECDENMERRSTEYMQRWIRSLNVIKKRTEKHEKNDLRRFFGTE